MLKEAEQLCATGGKTAVHVSTFDQPAREKSLALPFAVTHDQKTRWLLGRESSVRMARDPGASRKVDAPLPRTLYLKHLILTAHRC
jgi:hypothetical protein